VKMIERVLGWLQAGDLFENEYRVPLLAVTLFHGPGKLSLDHWIWQRLVSKRSAASAR